jgi:1,2-diacylglycerol 3-alpha-glucosyltransferase
MRIAMYTDSFYPYLSGVSTAVLVLAQSLATAGHQVFIQAPRPKIAADTTFLHPNITLNYVASMDIKIYPDFRVGTGLPLSMRKIRDFNPDIIHVHTPLSVGLEGTLVAKALGVPAVQTFHTYYMTEDAMKILGIHNQSLAQLVVKGGWQLHRAISRFYDVTTVPSQFVADELLQHDTPGKIIVCPNMLDDANYSPHPNFGEYTQNFLHVGRLSPEKRVNLLLDSFALVHAKNPETKLIIIGDGPDRNDLFAQSIELGIAPFVTWFGKIPSEELIRRHLFHHGDVFVTQSRYETFGYTTLEALAHQLPVIALACRGTTELVGDAGILIPDTEDEAIAVDGIAEAMLAITKMKLSPLRKKAYAQAQNYRPAVLLPKYIAMYEFAQQHH